MAREAVSMRSSFGIAAAMVALTGTAMASPFGTLLAGDPPANLGAPGGRFAPCPDRPNCVSSQAADAEHAIAPLAIQGDPATAMARLADAIRAMPGATVVVVRPDYLRSEFASALFGFVDDVEFALVPGATAIAVRSASRRGYSDFGVNRKRVEMLRAAFAAK
jgi:uncharacterized protein (DUF1499 family)